MKKPSLERLLRILSLKLELIVIVLVAVFAADPSFCYTSFELNSDRVSHTKSATREQMTPIVDRPAIARAGSSVHQVGG